jgi:hypothetical protein
VLTLDGAAIAPIEADLPAAQRIVGGCFLRRRW